MPQIKGIRLEKTASKPADSAARLVGYNRYRATPSPETGQYKLRLNRLKSSLGRRTLREESIRSASV